MIAPDALRTRHARRLSTLDAARVELDALRREVLGTPAVNRWLTRAQPAAEDRLTEVLRHRARGTDLAERLRIEGEGLRHAIRTAPPGELAAALREAQEPLNEALASAVALAAVCDEAAHDLEAALTDDRHRSRRELAAAVSRVDARIHRGVRQEADRGVLLTAALDALVHAFAPLAPDSPQGEAAEREVARALTPRTLDDLVASARRRDR